MSAMVHDLRAVGREIFEDEQVQNVIPALLNRPEHCKNVKLVMTHYEDMKTFAEIQTHIEWKKST